MISKKLHFEIAFPDVPAPVEDFWLILMQYLESRRALPDTFQISQIVGHREDLQSERAFFLKPSEVAPLISSRKLDGFHVHNGYSGDSVSYSLYAKGLGRQSVFLCHLGLNAVAPSDWADLIVRVSIISPTIGAWQFNNYYRSWQSACLVEGYELCFGKLPPSAKTYIVKSVDGIGPDREFIDYSLNPGRSKEIMPGVRFYPTAEMWLGSHFWKYAACSKEEVLSAEFFLEVRDTSHFLYLKSWPEAFTRPDGEQGRIQQKIWRLLFHEDCEWPPGSGGISEKAIYGPPELMPALGRQRGGPEARRDHSV